jgi:ABC-type sulfate transport system permease subunit
MAGPVMSITVDSVSNNFVAAFAVASLLALLALFTLGAKALVEWRARS